MNEELESWPYPDSTNEAPPAPEPSAGSMEEHNARSFNHCPDAVGTPPAIENEDVHYDPDGFQDESQDAPVRKRRKRGGKPRAHQRDRQMY